MRFDYSQHMKMGQHMKLAPRMIQSMEILQMPLAELEERIERELESNATLEVAERHGDRATLDHQREDADRDATENERTRCGSMSRARRPTSSDSMRSSTPTRILRRTRTRTRPNAWTLSPAIAAWRRPMAMMCSIPSTAAEDRSRPLSDQLLEQWRLADVDPRTMALGEMLIGFLDERGTLQLRDEAHPRALAARDRARPSAAGPSRCKRRWTPVAHDGRA
jgi:RNA polymerase sigma-54 factor